MSKKDLHIAFGFSGKAVFVQSELIDPDLGEVVGFVDPLSEGPICDLDDVEAIQKRKAWLQRLFGSIQSEGDNNFIDDDLKLLERIVATVNDFNNIYLWLGEEANEKLTTARLLYHLQGLTIPVYRLRFDQMQFLDENGKKLNISSLQVMRVENIPEASRYFEKLSADYHRSLVEIWKRIRRDGTVVHLFDRSGEYVSGDEDFFDGYLLNRISDAPQRSSLIVAYTLCDIWDRFGGGCVGDIFLFNRINQLAIMGKIVISNPHEDVERAKMIFDVRKVS